ncbi:MAG: thioredoxin [Paludibacteraceae bacterium]|nr:thioredoxin [Paludibacteraceae bacterium]MBP6283829.1 thioredoxin [Paludibacteraceae bacterium]
MKLLKPIISLLFILLTSSMSAQLKINKQDFLKKVWNFETHKNELVLNSDLPVILDFYADWCGPCRMLAPELEALQREYNGRILIYKVNVDEERELAAIFNARSLPTIFFLPTEGSPTYMMGYRTRAELKQIVDNVLLSKPRIQQ